MMRLPNCVSHRRLFIAVLRTAGPAECLARVALDTREVCVHYVHDEKYVVGRVKDDLVLVQDERFSADNDVVLFVSPH